MILGDMLRQFNDPNVVATALMASGDLRLLAQVEQNAAVHGETAGEYASASVRLFSNQANHDDWAALMAAMGHADDPGAACLRRMLEWALFREGRDGSGCGCGGGE
jgi:hypothetical protein